MPLFARSDTDGELGAAARYGHGQGMASTAIALSTAAMALTSIMWLKILGAG